MKNVSGMHAKECSINSLSIPMSRTVSQKPVLYFQYTTQIGITVSRSTDSSDEANFHISTFQGYLAVLTMECLTPVQRSTR